MREKLARRASGETDEGTPPTARPRYRPIRTVFTTAMHIGRARKLRQNMTDAERRLWSGLRDRRLSGLKFRRQHPVGAYIADFVCVEAMLVVEADGSQHRADERLEYDWRRTKVIEADGYCVLRFDNVEILRYPRQVFDKIAAKAAERKQMLQESNPDNGCAASPHQSRR